MLILIYQLRVYEALKLIFKAPMVIVDMRLTNKNLLN